MQIVSIPCLFFLRMKIIPRTTSNMTANTDDTATAMVELSVVPDIGGQQGGSWM